jgi:hypothetical protein
MKKSIVYAAIAALTCQAATPAFAGGPFHPTTALGWQRTSGPAAMAYVRVPFHARKTDRDQPRAGFMLTSPGAYRPGDAYSRISAPGLVDFGFTGRNFKSPWTATLNLSSQVAWASDKDELPKNTRYLFESGTSWLVVGVVSAGIIVGVYALSERDK